MNFRQQITKEGGAIENRLPIDCQGGVGVGYKNFQVNAIVAQPESSNPPHPPLPGENYDRSLA